MAFQFSSAPSYPLVDNDNKTRPEYEAGLGVGDGLTVPGMMLGIVIPHLICTVFIVLRACSRIICLRKWFVDDTLMVVAWICSTAICVAYSLAVLLPGIRDTKITPDSPITAYLLRTYIGLIVYQLSLCFSKLSIAAFYLRMLGSRPTMRWLSKATMFLVVGFGLPLMVMSVLQCYPSEGYVLGKQMGCLDFTELLVFSSCVHTATDVWLIILVVPTVSRLELPMRQKVALTVILSLGIFVIAASMIRLQLSLHKDFKPTTGVQESNSMAFFIMTILECDIAIICASAPMIGPIVSKMWHSRQKKVVKRRGRFDRSIDLTVVSYHGYPWADPPSRTRASTIHSPNLSLATVRMAIMRPGRPSISPNLRTPSPLSLQSLVSATPPRNRATTMSGGDTTPMLGSNSDGPDSRRSSVGVESIGDQYFGYNKGDRGSNSTGSPYAAMGSKDWQNSHESFMAPNDPASPRRSYMPSPLRAAFMGDQRSPTEYIGKVKKSSGGF